MKIEQLDVNNKLLSEYERSYNGGVTIIRRKDTLNPRPKRVNVYVDGILTSLPVDMFNRLMDTGFYMVVERKF